MLYPEDPFALHEELARACNDGMITERAVELALARQDALVRKLSPFRSLPQSSGVLRCPEHLAFNSEAAPACLAWALGEGKFRLAPGDTVGYFEPLTKREGWKGEAFVGELSRLGARVEPYQPGCGMRLAAGLFSRPRAGSGSINLSAEEKRALEAAAAGAASSVLLAFGSPYVLGGLENRPSAALCAFCALEDFQKAAARVLFGAPVSGRMPVEI
jgi:hypothetical protein